MASEWCRSASCASLDFLKLAEVFAKHVFAVLLARALCSGTVYRYRAMNAVRYGH